MIDTKRRYVRPSETMIFAASNGGLCMSYVIILGYLTYFLVNVFNVDSKIVAVMLLAEGVWDTVNDLMMGTIVDKTRTRYGKLKPYMLLVPVPMGICTLALFAGPLLVGDAAPNAPVKVIYMTVTYFLWELFFTMGDVPFWGLTAAVSPNPEDRSRVITRTRLFSTIFLSPVLAIPILMDLVNNGTLNTSIQMVFFGVAVLAGTVGMGLFSLPAFFAKERVMQNDDQPSFRECVKYMFQNRPLRLLIFKDFLGAFGSFGGIYQNYYNIDVLGAASLMLLTEALNLVSGPLGFGLIPAVKKRLNSRQILIVTKLYDVTIALLKFALGFRRFNQVGFMVPLLLGLGGLGGLTAGINSVVPTEMIGDTVDYSEWKTGQRTEGMSFAVLTFVGKLNGTVARVIGTWSLSLIGYKTSSESVKVPQTMTTQKRIFAMYTIIPALMGLGSIIPLLFYDLVGDKRQKMLDELELIRAERLKLEQAKDKAAAAVPQG